MFDRQTHKFSKPLFYHFNVFTQITNGLPYKIKHAIISDDQYGLEVSQSKVWPYFIDRLLEISEGNISSLNLGRIGQSKDEINEIKI